MPDAAAPLFRDPIFDGAADPTVIYNPHEDAWWMVYTNRPTTNTIEKGIYWLFGSDLGVASSDDGGATWQYRGILENLAFEWGRGTYWAPEIFEHEGVFHMYVSYIRGIPVGGPPAEMKIHHYTSSDLLDWTHVGPLALHSDFVIDACVIRRPDGGFRMWYKDQLNGSITWAADSDDLYEWTDRAEVLRTPGGHEGPNVFELGGFFWLIVDTWAGQLVTRSTDLEKWTEQGLILAGEHGVPNTRADDVGPGLHADVVVSGERAWIFYFTHPDRVGSEHPTVRSRRSSIQVAELRVEDGTLVCERDRVAAPQL
ncbi:glycoside hydrolase family protein [Planctomonas psychrotolerans]|uniref:family 43 glycosylhydrolase n=1 Tax=Planctomonas psychrotolerans TaxID=2528712 RepID=UPI001238FA6F|nr:family 43 glycosylhydrolase [Planctomonas psychrotolerans]